VLIFNYLVLEILKYIYFFLMKYGHMQRNTHTCICMNAQFYDLYNL